MWSDTAAAGSSRRASLRGAVREDAMKNIKTAMTAVGFAALFAIASPAAADGVRVLVSRADIGGHPVYRYRVINNSTQRIVSLQVGYDYAHGVYALDVAPLGWSRDTGLPPA